MKATALCGALLALSHSCTRTAEAEAEGAGVGVSLADCPSLDERALREHLALELVTLELEHVSAALRVRCEAGSANIELSSAQGRYPVQVRVELRDTAKTARERLVALAATELLAQAARARSSLANEPASRDAAPGSPAGRPERVAAPRALREYRPVELFAAASVALDGAPKTTLFGGSLGTLLGLGRHWALLFDTRFERGSAELSVASVRWSVLSAFAGPAFQHDAESLRLGLGLGLRAGWLAFDATAPAPHEGLGVTAPWAGLALPVRLSTSLGPRLVPFIGVEAGYVLLRVRGNLERRSSAGSVETGALIEQRGAWLSASGGIGVAL